MQEVDPGKPGPHATRRQVAFPQLQPESQCADDEAGEKRRDCRRSSEPFAQDAEEEAGRDRWRDVRLYTLQIDEDLRRDVLHERNPDEPEADENDRRRAADLYEALLARIRTDLSVDVPREKCRAGVECRRQ